ncbi:MAG: PAS domain S-box protein, partial [Magnetococcales bacterium]|nr:PAS domain S-box protein [Magnetococcales bacterium]
MQFNRKLMIIVFFGISLLLIFGLLHRVEKAEQEFFREVRASVIHKQQLLNIALQDDWHHILTDLSLLAKTQRFRLLLEQISKNKAEEKVGPLKDLRNEVQQRLQEVISAKSIYHKITLIDTMGREAAEMRFKNGRFIASVPSDSEQPAILENEQPLEDQSRSDFFVKAMRLNQGETYVSPFYLNKEFKKIEIPYLPTIHFSTPIFDDQDTRLGLLVLSYRGKALLDILRYFNHNGREIELLDQDGYWLYNKSENNLFDFEFDGILSFRSSFPMAWQVISYGSEGIFEDADSIYLFHEFRPFYYEKNNLDESSLSSFLKSTSKGSIALEEYHWKIVSRVNKDQLREEFAPERGKILIIGGLSEFLLMLLLMVGLWLDARNRQIEQENQDDLNAQRLFYHLQAISQKELELESKLQLFLDTLLTIPWLRGRCGGEISLISQKKHNSVLTVTSAQAKAAIGCRAHLPDGCPAWQESKQDRAIAFRVCDHLSNDHEVRLCFQIFTNAHILAQIAIYIDSQNPLSRIYLHGKSDFPLAEKVLSYINNSLQLLNELVIQEHNREELRKFKRVVEQSPVSVVITDTEGSIEYVNRQFTQVSGYTFEELLGKNPRLIKSNQHTVEFYLEMWRTLGQGQQWQGELCNRRKDGSIYWESAVISPIRDKAGRITHYVGIKVDITRERQAREERSKLEGQLRQAQKMEALGQLTGGIAHDFNNILAAIKGFSELAMVRFAQDNSSKLHHYLENILTASARAQGLIAQMMSFSRTQESEVKRVVLPPLVKEVIKLVRATLPASISITVTIDANDASINADPVQLHQTMMNLFINARDALQGKGRI